MKNVNMIAEEELQNLQGSEAIKKVQEFAEDVPECLFCSGIKTGVPLSVSPMRVLEADGEGNLWFISPKDSKKNEEIGQDPFVHVLFQHNRSGFLNIYGIAEIVDDKNRIEKLWKPVMNNWLDEDKDDPSLALIKVVPTKGHYWDNKHGAVMSFIRKAASVVNKRAADGTVEGDLEL